MKLEKAKIEEEEKVRAAFFEWKKIELDSNLEMLEHEQTSAAARACADVLNDQAASLPDEVEDSSPIADKFDLKSLPFARASHLVSE